MRSLFVILLVTMSLLSVLAVGTLPDRRSDAPLLWWTSDPNPARGPQIAAFERWTAEKGYGEVDLELDSKNTGTMKVIIQSASGVGSEIIDVYGGGQLRQLVAAGVLADVTDLAREFGFGLDKTYAAAREELFVGDRQYAFPCNVSAWPLTINRAVLEREGLPLPKYDWTWEEFLDWALRVRKVEPDGTVKRFALWPLSLSRIWQFWATNGGTIFNETMTRCVADSPENLEATRFYYDLMFVHKVMPTPVEVAARASQGGYGGSMLQWLGHELVVAVSIGRFGLIQLRRFEDFKPDVALLPYKVMPMQFVATRAAAVNAGARDKRLTARFLQFLADEPYNRIIIGDADALPPNPATTSAPEFIAPRAYPQEHGVHEKYARAAIEYGVGREFSPFISPVTMERIIYYYNSGIASRTLAIEEGLAKMAAEMNREIQNAVRRDAKLEAAYAAATTRQAEIDRLKSEGQPVPVEMIDNPVIVKLRGGSSTVRDRIGRPAAAMTSGRSLSQ